MARVTDARRSRLVLVGLVLIHLAVISRQVESEGGGPDLLARTLFALAGPFQRGGAAVTGAVSSAWSGYVDLRGARAEAVRLEERVRYLEILLQQRQDQAREAERLRDLVELKAALPLDTIGARVVARDGLPFFRRLTLDRGTADGVRADAPVIGAHGVVGRVVEPQLTAHACGVQLILDPQAGAGGRVERSRASGVLVGRMGAAGPELEMRYVPMTADVVVGDAVVTSGLDQIYPRGLLLGRVASVGQGDGVFKEITVTPSEDMDRLEEVLVGRVR